jgi:hypothetical protein
METVLLHAAELFCFCLAIHIFVWRTFPVRHHGIRLALIFSLGAAALVAAYALLLGLFGGSLDWPSWGLACLLHFSMSAAYMVLYTGVAGFSPSLGILERVDESMPHGLLRAQLPPPWFSDKNLSGTRLENLLSSGFVYQSGGLLQLTERGRLIAGWVLAYRRFLGLPDVAKG